MREFFFIVSSEKKMIRDYALAVLVIALIAFAGTHGLKAAADALSSERAQKVTSNTTNSVKTYTVTRSILDDNPVTGSIQSLNNVRFDPCRKP